MSSDRQHFQTALYAIASQIDARLEALLPAPSGDQSDIMMAMRYAAIDGGKRLRPFLLMQSVEMLSVSKPQNEDERSNTMKAALDIACALECVHVYSLVHDDLPCMDDDDLRHGKPTVHKQYDEAMAVLAGDGLLTYAFEIITQTQSISADQKINLISSLAKAAGSHGMIGGQVIDMGAAHWSETQRQDPNLIGTLQALKTGALIEFSLEASVILTTQNKADFRALSVYGRALGLAFQIRDDILDFEGTQENMGKAVGKDEGLGKATFVSLYGMEGAKSKAQELVETAKSAIKPYGAQGQSLIQCADFVLYRQK